VVLVAALTAASWRASRPPTSTVTGSTYGFVWQRVAVESAMHRMRNRGPPGTGSITCVLLVIVVSIYGVHHPRAASSSVSRHGSSTGAIRQSGA
jgi:hypothetical protein